MSRIILQPAGNPDASAHYVDSISNPTKIDKIAKFVDAETVQKLRELHKNDTVPTWGVTTGKKNVNKNKWDKVEPGDIVLFSRDNQIFASAAVSFKIHNKGLALELWKTNDDGETWEYMYFLDEINKQSIPVKEFNRIADYQPKNVIQGFNVLDEERSEKIIAYFELGSDTYYPPVSRKEYFEAVEIDPSKMLDKESVVKGRTEQAFLRSLLFKGKKYAKCGICGQEYPVPFLVTAHIKKRSDCSDDEKRDFNNIVMPMCRFGCDDLYEKGYVTVKDGVVTSLKRPDTTDAVISYIKKLEGLKCDYWTSDNSKYFQWHLEKHQ